MTLSNIIPVTALGGGGGGGPTPGPFPFRPTSADLDTPIVTGTVTSVVVTDVAGAIQGGVVDYLRVTTTDPQAGAIVEIPILLPVTPLPDRFGLRLNMFTGGPPSVDFKTGLAFRDSTGDRAWDISHSVDITGTTRPVVRLLEIDSFVIGASWDLPDALISNSIGLTAVVEKVAPFTAIPQVRFDIQAGNGFQSDVSQVASTALTAAPSAGVISPGWLGEDFVSASFIFVFLNTAVGDVDLFIQLEFVPHIRDLYPV